MITSDQIPDEVVEAACISRHGVNWYRYTESYREIERASARAAIAAALAAWPENTVEFRRDSYMGWDGNLLILPLPQEARDEPTTDRRYNVAERLFGDD